MAEQRAIVVGAGIMGTSTAWGLHRRGWSVTLLDAGAVPNPHGSSGGVHRLIRTTYGDELGYTQMIGDAYAAWDQVWSVLGRRLLAHTGMLAVDSDTETFGADTATVLQQLDLPHEVLDRDQLRARFPQFHVPDDATALYTDDAHFLRAREIVGAMTSWLAADGVAVRPHSPVDGVDLDAGTVGLAGGEQLQADRVVVAAGPWTSELAGLEAPELTPSRQVVLDLRPPGHLRQAWAEGPAFLVPPMYGIPPREELPLKVADHEFSLRGHPDDDRAPQPQEIEAGLEAAGHALVDIGSYELLEARVCYYTVHDEERFVVEPRGERSAVLCGFSGHGFKFGPLIGERAARALAGESDWAEVTAWAAGAPSTEA